MFSVELADSEDGVETVSIYVSKAEAEQLARDFAELANSKEHKTLKFFSKSWGGHNLVETPIVKGRRVAKALLVYTLDDHLFENP
ncbi:MAG: hypothetical protein HRU32_09610 [Rhodobacteraceae bacterium]|nr:hypothetical protein [Paracoccaceae bacterium]